MNVIKEGVGGQRAFAAQSAVKEDTLGRFVLQLLFSFCNHYQEFYKKVRLTEYNGKFIFISKKEEKKIGQ